MSEPSGVDTIVDALAVARLTRLVVVDTFPPVEKIRFKILQRWPANSWQVELLTCPWCISMWIGLFVVAVRRVPGWRPLSRALAFCAFAGFFNEKV